MRNGYGYDWTGILAWSLRKVASIVLSFAVLSLLYVTAVLASEVIPSTPDDQFFAYLFSSVGGLMGASTLGAVGIILQILHKFMETEFFKNWSVGKIEERGKVTIYLGLAWLIGVTALMLGSGLTFWAALTHATVVAAIVKFGNHVIESYVVKPADPEQKQ